jgi:hypothetical protein
MSCFKILRVIFFSLLLFPILLFAQGRVFWQENGVCVCDGFFDGGSEPLAIVKDGSGGAIITWADSRGGYHEAVYAQKIDKDGHCIWTINGVSLKDSIWVPRIIRAVSDGKGGVICVWEEGFTPSYSVQITAQSIDSLGQVRWGPNGIVVIGTNADCMYYPSLISDGRGGAIVAWLAEESNPYSWKILAQRIDSLGNNCWAPDGVLITDSIPWGIHYDCAVSDGIGGIIIVWEDIRSGELNIFAQRIDSIGTTLWNPGGIPICVALNSQSGGLVYNDRYGIIITWADKRAGDWNTYAQRLNWTGENQWRVNGIPICSVPGAQGPGKIIGDRNGGAIIVWYDERMGNHDIYAQRVDSLGNIHWNPIGVYIITAADSSQERIYLDMTTDTRDGVVICWSDFRIGNWDIYCQRVNDNGLLLWGDSGLVVCTDTQDQYWRPVITEDETGGAIIAWGDMRPIGSGASIYAQRVGDVVGIDKADDRITSDDRIQIFPNPAKSVMRVRGPLSEKIIKIFDASGRLIKEIATPSEFASQSIGTRSALRNDEVVEISLKGINPGIYFLELGKKVRKFIITR